MKKTAMILLSAVGLACVAFLLIHSINKDVVSSKPDMSGWVLSNENFVVVPTVGENVSFHVEDKQKRTVFTCDKEWRAWDFESLGIDENSKITVTTGDMGEQYYCYNGETWVFTP